jgi:osmotically-inducible protein OsmY
MKRNIFALVVVLALCAMFAVAQSPSTQDQSQQTPTAAQQPSSPSGAGQAGGSDQSVQQVQSALQQQPELSGVMASASGDKIELTGTVAKKADKDKAKSVAESAAGGKKVVDKIKVSGGSSAAPSSDSTQPPKS